jgi:hypothetical protein
MLLMQMVDGISAWMGAHGHERLAEVVGAANLRIQGGANDACVAGGIDRAQNYFLCWIARR